MTRGRLTGGAGLVLVLVASAGAQMPPGTAQLTGAAVLAVAGCGADREPHLSTTVTLFGDGSWTAEDAQGDTFGGTSTPVGTSGRAFDLFFDADTDADLIATVAEDVGMLCDAPGAVTVTSAQRRRLRLSFNRRLTKVKLVLRYVFRGQANGRSGSARYRLRGKGPFSPAG